MISDPLGLQLLGIIEEHIATRPRNLQTRIGPSEIGDECNRALLYKLNETPEPPGPPKWKAAVGTFVHTGLQNAIDEYLEVWLPREPWATESRVSIGHVAEIEIVGSCDLLAGRHVRDWKTASKTKLQTVARHGLPGVTRVQVHAYGRGWQRRGKTPETVGAIYLPRDGELRDAIHVWEDYDEQIAVAALERCTALLNLSRAFGFDQALALYPLCDSDICDWCKRDRARQPRTQGISALIGA